MGEECEVCGERDAVFLAEIEGAKLHVCPDCARRGKILSRISAPPKSRGVVVKKEVREIEVVPDYGRRIKKAREKLGIGRDVLAERINEKESYIERIEAEKTVPTVKVARKLEKELGVVLFEEVSEERVVGQKSEGGMLTLGDLVVVKKKKGD